MDETRERIQIRFCLAVAHHCPQVLNSLADHVLPAYEQHGSTGERPQPYEDLPAPLETALRKWAETHHLTDSWVLEHAIATLHFWAVHPIWSADRLFDDQHQPVPRRWVFAEPTEGELIPEAGHPGLTVTLRLPPWDRQFQKWKEFERAAIEQVRESLAQYRQRVKKGTPKRPRKRPKLDEHLEWLVLSQIRGKSASELSHGEVDLRAITLAISRLADRIGLTRWKIQGGRPTNDPTRF